ncbi:MAG: serine/threonine protein kinase [Akkermansiaceae bacterium]
MLSQGLSSQAPAEEPDIVGYEIRKLLGQGGMSKVYLAREEALNRLVALKIFNADAIDAICVERFYQEAQMMAQIQHPNIVSIYGQVSYGREIPCLVLEYVPGGDLRSKLSNEGSLQIMEAKRIALDVCSGLKAIHEKQIVHRDINPANVLLDENGKAKVADLGIALDKQIEGHAEGLTMTGTFVGTMAYLAPEQIAGSRNDVDVRTDVWAVGVLLFEMLVGVPPQGVLVSDLLGDVPAVIKPIVRKCLRRNPSDRYQDIASLQRDLERVSTAPSAGRMAKLGVMITSVILISCGVYWLGKRPGDSVAKTSPAEIEGQPSAPHAAAPASELPNDTASEDTAESAEIDVLSRMQAPLRPVRGLWNLRGDTLISSPHARGGILPLPVASPGMNYDFSLSINRISGNNSVSVFLPTSIGMLNFDLDGWNKHLSGIQNLDGEDMRHHGENFSFTIEPRKPYVLLLQIREHSITVSINGVKHYQWNLQGRRGTLSSPWKIAISDRLALGAWDSAIEFKNIRFKKIAP